MPRSCDRVQPMAPEADAYVLFLLLREIQNALVAREGLPNSEAGGTAGKNRPDAAGRWTSQPLWTNRGMIRAGTHFGEGQVVAILVDQPQSAGLCDMVAAERALQKMASLTTHSAPLPYAALRRRSSKVEAVCVNAHVRICAGGAG